MGEHHTPLDAGLLPLADYGGPTQTHGLLADSPAINAGSNVLVGALTDQRGLDRIESGTVDIGAFELAADAFPGQAPQVVGVKVNGSASTHAPYSFNGVVGSGEQLRTVPVGGADTVTIAFSENVVVQQSDLSLVGLQTADRPSVSGFAYAPNTLEATWTFGAPFAADQYLIELADSVTDGGGDALDGEWTNPASLTTTNANVSTFPSGDGVAGGGFEFVFANLPGDFNRDNTVNGADFLILQAGGGISTPTFTDGDANGDGVVNGDDLSLWSANSGTALIDLALAADFDDDYDVDGSDFLEWQLQQGQIVTPGENGDADGDGDVDIDDLDILNVLFGIDLEVLI